MAEVFPLYGPIAGGTDINVTGGYFIGDVRFISSDFRADFREDPDRYAVLSLISSL